MTVLTKPLSETSFHGVVSNPRCYMQKNTMYFCGLYTMFISLSDMFLFQHCCSPLPLGDGILPKPCYISPHVRSTPERLTLHSPAQHIFLEGNSNWKNKITMYGVHWSILSLLTAKYTNIPNLIIYFFTFCRFNMCMQYIWLWLCCSHLLLRCKYSWTSQWATRGQKVINAAVIGEEGKGHHRYFRNCETEVALIYIILPKKR